MAERLKGRTHGKDVVTCKGTTMLVYIGADDSSRWPHLTHPFDLIALESAAELLEELRDGLGVRANAAKHVVQHLGLSDGQTKRQGGETSSDMTGHS